MSEFIKEHFDALKRAMQNDPSYAWAWHCNIAMMTQDAGCDHSIAQDGAARFMKLCFDVDTSKGPGQQEPPEYVDNPEYFPLGVAQ